MAKPVGGFMLDLRRRGIGRRRGCPDDGIGGRVAAVGRSGLVQLRRKTRATRTAT